MYARLTPHRATRLHLGSDGVRLNPFDLPAAVPGIRPSVDALTRQPRSSFKRDGIAGGRPQVSEAAGANIQVTELFDLGLRRARAQGTRGQCPAAVEFC